MARSKQTTKGEKSPARGAGLTNRKEMAKKRGPRASPSRLHKTQGNKSRVTKATDRKSQVSKASSKKIHVTKATSKKSQVSKAAGKKSQVTKTTSKKSQVTKATSKKSQVTKATGKKSQVTKKSSDGTTTKKAMKKESNGRTNKIAAKLNDTCKVKAARTKTGKQSPSNNSKKNEVSPKKPPKFSWIEEGVLAGQGRPTQPGHIQFLVDNGVKYIVTLTLNKPRALLELPDSLTWVHIPIQDETPPSLTQTTEFVDLVLKAKNEKQGAVSAHCAWGRGRTGTMLACYLVRSQGTRAQQAIETIRTMRPGSIDTEKQVNAVKEYAASLGY